MNKLYTEL